MQRSLKNALGRGGTFLCRSSFRLGSFVTMNRRTYWWSQLSLFELSECSATSNATSLHTANVTCL